MPGFLNARNRLYTVLPPPRALSTLVLHHVAGIAIGCHYASEMRQWQCMKDPATYLSGARVLLYSCEICSLGCEWVVRSPWLPCWGNELFDASKGLHITTQAQGSLTQMSGVSCSSQLASISGVNHGVNTNFSPKKRCE